VAAPPADGTAGRTLPHCEFPVQPNGPAGNTVCHQDTCGYHSSCYSRRAAGGNTPMAPAGPLDRWLRRAPLEPLQRQAAAPEIREPCDQQTAEPPSSNEQQEQRAPGATLQAYFTSASHEADAIVEAPRKRRRPPGRWAGQTAAVCRRFAVAAVAVGTPPLHAACSVLPQPP
jgi:hypothetical protein